MSLALGERHRIGLALHQRRHPLGRRHIALPADTPDRRPRIALAVIVENADAFGRNLRRPPDRATAETLMRRVRRVVPTGIGHLIHFIDMLEMTDGAEEDHRNRSHSFTNQFPQIRRSQSAPMTFGCFQKG